MRMRLRLRGVRLRDRVGLLNMEMGERIFLRRARTRRGEGHYLIGNEKRPLTVLEERCDPSVGI